MSTKIIKLHNGLTTYIPVTDASAVQFSPESISVESKITSVDALSKLGKIYIGTSDGPVASYQKVATTTEAFPTDSSGHPITGVIVAIKFSASSTYKTAGNNYTLEVILPGNISTGEFSIWYNGGTVASTTSANTTVGGYANRYNIYMFDGTYWVWMSYGYDANSTYSNVGLGQGYANCTTAAVTKAKTASLSSYALTDNGIVAIRFESGNTNTAPTLNINSKGAKNISWRNSATIPADLIQAGDIVTMIYSTDYKIISIARRNGNVIYADETYNRLVLKDNDTELTVAYLKTINNLATVGQGNITIPLPGTHWLSASYTSGQATYINLDGDTDQQYGTVGIIGAGSTTVSYTTGGNIIISSTTPDTSKNVTTEDTLTASYIIVGGNNKTVSKSTATISTAAVSSTSNNYQVPTSKAVYDGVTSILTSYSKTDHNHQIGFTGDIELSPATDLSTSLSPTVNKATNLRGGASLRIAYQTAADTTGFVTAPSASGHFLTYDGTKLAWSADNNTAILNVSGTLGRTNDISSTEVVNPYLNVHPTLVGSGGAASQFKGSGTNQSGSKTAYVWVTGKALDNTITIHATYTDTVPDYSNTYAPKSHSHGNITNGGQLPNAYKGYVAIIDNNAYLTGSSSITTTELDYLDGVTSNIQTQINNINNAISTGVTFKGTWSNGTLPETASSSTVGHMWTYIGTGTFNLAEVTNGNDAEVLRKGDAIIGVNNGATYYWCAIDNNADVATSSELGLVKPGSGSSAPTMDVAVASDGEMTVTHYTPASDTSSKLSKDASGGSAIAANTATQIVTGVDIERDTKGHVTNLSLDSASITIPSIPYNFKTITAGANSTSTGAGTANTSSCVADSTEDTLTVSPGNKWITTGTSDSSNNDILYINHALVASGTATTVTTSGNSSLTHDSSLVITGISYNIDAAGHVYSITATTGKLPTDSDEKVKEWGKSDSKTYPVLFSYTNSNASASSSTANYVASDTDGVTNFYYNPSSNLLHAKHMNSDDSSSVPTGITSNLNYVQGNDITLDETFLSNALGSTTSNVTGAAASGTATVIVNYSA